jgi:catechol 2,3-dioxygenase-like lactoylglutathione lyase family enzyme
MKRPEGLIGMHHVALNVKNIEACERFYTELLGMRVEWRPDTDNVYLTGGSDNLALHRASDDFTPVSQQHLDHIGFILADPGQVDAWHRFLRDNNINIVKEPKTHRDGARSFYCRDPDGNTVQIIYHPPLAKPE